VVAGNISWPDG